MLPAQLSQQTAASKNDALREIAGRLKRLSYRDMRSFSGLLASKLPVAVADLAPYLLEVADALEKA